MDSAQQQQKDEVAPPIGLTLNDAPLTDAEEKGTHEMMNEPTDSEQQQNDEVPPAIGLALNDAPFTEPEEKVTHEMMNEPKEQEMVDMMADVEENEKDEVMAEADEHDKGQEQSLNDLDDYLKSFEEDYLNKLEEDYLHGVEDEKDEMMTEADEEEPTHPTKPLPNYPNCIASSNVHLRAAQWMRKNGKYYIEDPDVVYCDFKGAQWAASSSVLVTNDTVNNLRTYSIPADILAATEVRNLSPYASYQAPESIYAFALSPGFHGLDASTNVMLCSVRDQTIRLINVWGGPSSVQNGSYRFVDPNTEKWTCPYSLAWTQSGARFVAGADSTLAIFDINRYGKPVKRHKTKNMTAKGVGVKGLVFAMRTNNDGVLAFGTTTRQVGLYSNEGDGFPVTFFSVSGNHKDKSDGRGVTDLEWSPCSKYLYVAERQSNIVHMYDVRVTARSLGYMEGRNAYTNQRLGINVASCSSGHDVWGGGIDGVVRSWTNPHWSGGVVLPSCQFQAHNEPVTSAVIDPTGHVLATCSGEKYPYASSDGSSDDDEEEEEADEPRLVKRLEDGLKLWKL
ncbi:WD40 repeat-like protein [Lophium mytilinum]|uniref:WD40 repeat-like protein n=1 Tax=Lophium mytilinum TaxID=390894 RepID=A0A6A6QUX5_9PEZI|nr:WD40 repeat-like protein [Lophium mytilinum]